MDISEDPWHLHLLSRVWQWSCHYLFYDIGLSRPGIEPRSPACEANAPFLSQRGGVFRPQLFCPWHSHCLARECITMILCVAYIHELCMNLTFDFNIKIIFSPWIWVWQNVFAFWHRHTKFWHMGVSPWDNMLCTFLTLVWPWPLTYMWVAGCILCEFNSQFLSCFYL